MTDLLWLSGRRRAVADPCEATIGPIVAADCHSATALLAWYKADAGISVSNGQPIELWADQSGAGKNASRTSNAGTPTGTLNVPVYNTSIAGGGPVVSFKNPNAGLDIPGLSVSRTSYTFYFLVRYDINQGNTSLILSAQSTHGGFEIQGDTPLEAGSPSVDYDFSSDIFVEGPSSHCGWQVLTVVADNGGGVSRLYRNGAQIHSRAYATDNSTDQAWALGDPGFGIGFVFDLAEVLLYSAAHGASEIATRATCLRNRWSLKSTQGV